MRTLARVGSCSRRHRGPARRLRVQRARTARQRRPPPRRPRRLRSHDGRSDDSTGHERRGHDRAAEEPASGNVVEINVKVGVDDVADAHRAGAAELAGRHHPAVGQRRGVPPARLRPGAEGRRRHRGRAAASPPTWPASSSSRATPPTRSSSSWWPARVGSVSSAALRRRRRRTGACRPGRRSPGRRGCAPEMTVSPSAARPATTIAAPARMSWALTGAPDSRGTPRTTAWWLSVRMSAPRRTSSST